MKKTKQLICVILTLAMTLSMFTACGGSKTGETIEATVQTTPAETVPQISEEASQQTAAEAPAAAYAPGDKIDDFTVTTHDGKTMSLYEILEQKDMVLLNFWATWCGPCGMEFPAMEEAYQQYKDQVEILAISAEPLDTAESVGAFAAEMGLTFPMAPGNAICNRFPSTSIPFTVVIDRFGTVCLMESGAKIDSSIFTGLFDVFLGEDYTQSIILPSMTAKKSTVMPASSEELTQAMGSDLVFTNSPNPYHWPMTVAEKEGKTVLVSENCTVPGSVSMLSTTVDVQPGDAIVMSFKMHSTSALDQLTLSVNGEPMKHFASTRDWTTYAHTFGTAGTYDVSVSYTKDDHSLDEDVYVWIDSIRLLSGDEAAAAVEQNPQYIVSPETRVQFLNENAKYLRFYLESAPEITLADSYLIDADTLNIKVTLDETVDPEGAYVVDGHGDTYSLLTCQQEDGYYITYTREPGSPGTTILISLGNEHVYLNVFFNEEAVTQKCEELSADPDIGETILWEYVDENKESAIVTGNVTYTVTYTDQNGDPVPGVMCQVCDATTCQVYVSDNNGVCQFTLPAYAYEIHTLKVPDGYEGDTTTVTYAPADGGELSFQLTKK